MRYIQCLGCHTLNEECLSHCQTCGKPARESSAQSPGIVQFPTGYWENLGPDPVYIRNRRQLRRVCEENDVRANILD